MATTIRINPQPPAAFVVDRAGRALPFVPGGHEVQDVVFWARRIAAAEAVRVHIDEVQPINKQPAKSGKKSSQAPEV